MNYGQIIFHLEDYYNYGGVISTTTSGEIQVIIEPKPPEESVGGEFEISDGSINIYEDLLNGTEWDKVGIQAPPGTKFILNNKEFIIGPSGIYELSNVIINQLYFLPLNKYKIDTNNTNTNLNEGKEIMQDALANYRSQTLRLTLDSQENIDLYKQITEEYITLYETGYNQYQVGLNGIYEQDGFQIQKNIIIDYREKPEQGEVNKA